TGEVKVEHHSQLEDSSSTKTAVSHAVDNLLHKNFMKLEKIDQCKSEANEVVIELNSPLEGSSSTEPESFSQS
ncbi:hypothetical protein Z043_117091, partial [Scleropages formosus]